MLQSIKLLGEKLLKDATNIPNKRKSTLNAIAQCMASELLEKGSAQVLYVCTHNSRRSHFGQIWSQVAANYFNFPVKTFSAGSEETAFHPNAIEALKEQGFLIKAEIETSNPLYLVSYAKEASAIRCFSKRINHIENPTKDFIAIMTCADADSNCPFVPGAISRFSTTYEDPKEFDGTELQKEKYLERSLEIGRDSFYIFLQVKAILTT